MTTTSRIFRRNSEVNRGSRRVSTTSRLSAVPTSRSFSYHPINTHRRCHHGVGLDDDYSPSLTPSPEPTVRRRLSSAKTGTGGAGGGGISWLTKRFSWSSGSSSSGGFCSHLHATNSGGGRGDVINGNLLSPQSYNRECCREGDCSREFTRRSRDHLSMGPIQELELLSGMQKKQKNGGESKGLWSKGMALWKKDNENEKTRKFSFFKRKSISKENGKDQVDPVYSLLRNAADRNVKCTASDCPTARRSADLSPNKTSSPSPLVPCTTPDCRCPCHIGHLVPQITVEDLQPKRRNKRPTRSFSIPASLSRYVS